MEGNGKGSVAEAADLARRRDVDVVPTAPVEPNLLPSAKYLDLFDENGFDPEPFEAGVQWGRTGPVLVPEAEW